MKREYKLGTVLDKDGSSLELKTGSWRTRRPIHSKEKCKNCMLCVVYCPEGCIKHTEDAILTEIDYDYCKGCGVCARVCPFKAIDMEQE